MLEETDNIAEIVKSTNLKHIAIIMDGNRRWAKEKGFPTAVGHKKGVSALKKTVEACKDFGIKYLTVYAFSTENWNRSPEEVSFLMDLFVKTITKELLELCQKDVSLNFIGDLSKLSPKLQKVLDDAKEKTKENKSVYLQIAINYGGRDEIVNSVKKIAKDVKNGIISADEISEDTISSNLYNPEMPNPDLLIRTGGEMRVSNYLLWQIAYSEFYVTKTYWPDFDKSALEDSVLEFNRRQRRYGA
ncbi:isoprenyl transferase [bacterium]|nr:isoprenyl transferase [bacterium]